MDMRLKVSEFTQGGPMIPRRMVLDELDDGRYRTFMESRAKDGVLMFRYGLIFETESEAVYDYHTRVQRL